MRFGLAMIGVTSVGLFYLNSRYQMFEHAGPMAPVSGIGDSELRPEGSPESVASEPVAPSHSTGPLTNEDVMKMWKSGVGTISLSSRIRRTEHRFTVDAGSIAKLRQSGVPEAIILTMVESTSPDATR